MRNTDWSKLVEGSRELICDAACDWKWPVETPHGCRVGSCGYEARIYLGGKTRVIGVGSLYQCSVLHDLALSFFCRYRRSDENDHFRYNNRAGLCSHVSPRTDLYFSSLESYLLSSGQLVVLAKRRAVSKSARAYTRRKYRQSRTVRQSIESLQEALLELGARVAALGG